MASAVLSTICLAVEWLLLAPLEARQSGMLQAAQLLLTFLLQRQPPLLPGGGGGGSAAWEGSGGPGSRQGGRSSDGGGGGWRQQQAQRGEEEHGGSLTAEGSMATVGGGGGGGATPGRGLRVDIPEDNGSPVQVRGWNIPEEGVGVWVQPRWILCAAAAAEHPPLLSPHIALISWKEAPSTYHCLSPTELFWLPLLLAACTHAHIQLK